MKKYIADWDVNVGAIEERGRDAGERSEAVPGLGMEFTLNDRVATYFPTKPAGTSDEDHRCRSGPPEYREGVLPIVEARRREHMGQAVVPFMARVLEHAAISRS